MGSETMNPALPPTITAANTQQTAKLTSLSKRKRRSAGPNPSNTWQQQPRIKSATARAKTDIAMAGLADDRTEESESIHSKRRAKKSVTQREETVTFVMDPQSPDMKFGRMLGGTDQRSRHRAVKMLREYLKARVDISKGCGMSELDLMKLWKGLWYTLYMADKVPVQDKLSQLLAELMWCLAGTEQDDEYAGQLYLQMNDEEESMSISDKVEEDEDLNEGKLRSHDNQDEQSDDESGKSDDSDEVKIFSVDEVEGSMENNSDDNEDIVEEEQNYDVEEKHCRGAHLVSLYFATFLRTIRREWGNLDKHRVDKFYTAVRLMLHEVYTYMAKRHWNLGIIRLFNDVLYDEALSLTPNGLRYHLIDICVVELAKVNKVAALSLTEATFLDCLEPFFALAQRAEDKNVQKRVMNSVLLKFLNEYSFVSDVALKRESDKEENHVQSLIFDQVHVGSVAKFLFEIASDCDTDERYRKELYLLHKSYIRQIRAAGRDVDLKNIENHLTDDDSSMDDETEKDIHPSEEKIQSFIDKRENVHHAKSANSFDNIDSCQNPLSSSKSSQVKSKGRISKSITEVEISPELSSSGTSSINDEEDKSKNKLTNVDTSVAISAFNNDPGPDAKKLKKRKKQKMDKSLSEQTEGSFCNNNPETPEKSSKKVNLNTQSNISSGKNASNSNHSMCVPKEKPVIDDKLALNSGNSTQPLKKKETKEKLAEVSECADLISSNSNFSTPVHKKAKMKKSPPSVDPHSMKYGDGLYHPCSSNKDRSVGFLSPKDISRDKNSASKRVSFGSVNQSKSHKASMKALKTLNPEVWKTVNRTPDKSILHK